MNARLVSCGLTAILSVLFLFPSHAAAKSNQQINWSLPSSVTYGASPLTLNATASSRLPVTYTVFSGPATLSKNLLTITGAGPVVIQASQSGNSQYNMALAFKTLLVNKARLNAKADNQSKTQGSANPVLTFTYSGFVNGDNAAVIDVPPVASTSAGSNSPVGTYPILLSGGADNNYNISNSPGVLTITAGSNPNNGYYYPGGATLNLGNNPGSGNSSLTFNGTVTSSNLTLSGNKSSNGTLTNGTLTPPPPTGATLTLNNGNTGGTLVNNGNGTLLPGGPLTQSGNLSIGGGINNSTLTGAGSNGTLTITITPAVQTLMVGNTLTIPLLLTSPLQASYQWQQSTDGGSTWLALLDGVVYSGTNTSTLQAFNVTLAMNNTQYRCILLPTSSSAGFSSGSSSVVTLFVNP